RHRGEQRADSPRSAQRRVPAPIDQTHSLMPSPNERTNERERCYAPEARRASRPREAPGTGVALGWREIALACDRIETRLASGDAAAVVPARVRRRSGP